MPSPGFDPTAHQMCEQRYFDDFKVGERFVLPSRTMTDALFAAFQLASGDNHPIHYDVEYCRANGMPHMLAHGFQVAIQTAAGAGLFPHMTEASMKASSSKARASWARSMWATRCTAHWKSWSSSPAGPRARSAWRAAS